MQRESLLTPPRALEEWLQCPPHRGRRESGAGHVRAGEGRPNKGQVEI